ncbi:MAG TPA: glycosidase, partial [Candidatus Limnocylindria bacterium]|nr:glycosidase [Candidatus Limnocylindria bacterium]
MLMKPIDPNRVGSKVVNVKRAGVTLNPDRTRVLIRPFRLTTEQRAINLCARIMSMAESEVHNLIEEVLTEFGERHQQIRDILNARFDKVRHYLLTNQKISDDRKQLIGAYFTHEYALESAALFNPSIVPHPDQSDLPEGSLRFILSLRATGEGHISSITFRTGVVDAQNKIIINSPTRFLAEPKQIPSSSYAKELFERKLYELRLTGSFSRRVLAQLSDAFTLGELRKTIAAALKQVRANEPENETIAQGILLLAESNYEVAFPAESRVSERVMFPASPTQTNGIEDARFVLFKNDDGSTVYYATYTAYDGKVILPQLLETPDFINFKFNTLNGPAVQNKGMALFPRKINGSYAMISRQ